MCISNVRHCQLVAVTGHFIAQWIFLVNGLNHEIKEGKEMHDFTSANCNLFN